jgi:hypothetical protein
LELPPARREFVVRSERRGSAPQYEVGFQVLLVKRHAIVSHQAHSEQHRAYGGHLNARAKGDLGKGLSDLSSLTSESASMPIRQLGLLNRFAIDLQQKQQQRLQLLLLFLKEVVVENPQKSHYEGSATDLTRTTRGEPNIRISAPALHRITPAMTRTV